MESAFSVVPVGGWDAGPAVVGGSIVGVSGRMTVSESPVVARS
jgi:hypothetical protein